ncbi:MAG: SDR family oxidoreductase [Bacteroidales bacterium]|nr:SDR family oxidoreductase [Bacteroidales bacterium]
MDNRWNLRGKKALITGGTKGIGKAIAHEFASLGAEIYIVSRTKQEVDHIINELADNGYKALGMAADVSRKEERLNLLDDVTEKWGMLDILINNVGTNIRKKAVEYSGNEYQHILQTNLTSAFELSVKCYPLLLKAKKGSVVNVSSVSGLTAMRTGAIYAMTKAAMIQMTKNLALEWGEAGIRVNAVAPWYIKTPLTEGVLNDEKYYDAVIGRTPLRKIGNPEDVAAAVSFLCMPAAAYITGQCLPVDGGFMVYGF